MQRTMCLVMTPMLLVACSGPEDEPPGLGAAAPRLCRVNDAARFVGQAGTSALAAEAREAANAASVRWLQPGSVVTMEFRGDRLNIVLDAANRVTGMRCG